VVVAPLTIQYASPNAATNSGLRLWPNPFKDWVTFQLPPASGLQGVLDIYDVQGRKIWTKSWQFNKGDAHFLPFKTLNYLMQGFISINTPMVLDNIQEI
jgi:hypothetical protein